MVKNIKQTNKIVQFIEIIDAYIYKLGKTLF